MTRNLTAQAVTRLAREAVYGNARFTTTTVAPGAFRVRAVSGVSGGHLGPVSQFNVLGEVRNHLIRLGYDASVSRQSSPRSHGTDAYLLTVIDSPRRQREVEEQETRRQEALKGAWRETFGEELTEESAARHTAETARVEAARNSAEAAEAPAVAAASDRMVTTLADSELPGEMRYDEFGARYWTAEEVAAEAAKAAEAAPEPSGPCGLCGRPRNALSHAYPGGHGFDPLPEVEVGVVELASAWDGYPPLSIADAEAFLAAGLHPVAEGAGGYSFRIEGADRRLLGKVRVVTEHLGRGIWVRYAAYRPDGSRVGYYDTRLGAAEALRAESLAPVPTGPVSLSETLDRREYIVRRDGEELGRVRTDDPQPTTLSPEGVRSTWQAWDAHGIRRVDAAASPALAASALVEGIDRRAADATEREAWKAEESKRWTPEVVLPSGRYGVLRVDRGYGPSLHVAQRFDNGRWGATPGCWGLETLAAMADTLSLSIDAGSGWGLDAADTAALRDLARADLAELVD